jgi:Protein of unknown function (DUF2889)
LTGGIPRDPLQAVNGPLGATPHRRAASIRRTSTIDGTWPHGPGGFLRLEGRARDAITHAPIDPPIPVATASTVVHIGANRTIEAISADPDTSGLHQLVGCRGGGYLRGALAEFVPHELEGGTPLYLLLDDLSGASLVAGFELMQWPELRPPGANPTAPDMEGVCIGFAPGSTALVELRSGQRTHRMQAVDPLTAPDDPHGWHDLPDEPDMFYRRARWVDVWRDPVHGTVRVESGFQDSGGHPVHSRVAVHEYVLHATADADAETLTAVTADPRVLPFLSCPNAVDTASAVVGTPLRELRVTVLERLAKTNGCTHLNDALRALAEVPILLAHLDAER